MVAYRLGLAHAETPAGRPEAGLRTALSYYDVAAAIFNPRHDPIEHARVLNAAGAAHRSLGDRERAAELFERAAGLLHGRDRDGERAAVLNNLGLVRTELGRIELAIEACDEAVELFDAGTPEGRRGRVATLHSRGMASAALDTDEGLETALADYRRATNELDPDEAPYHHGLVHHSLGVTYSALAARRPDERARLLGEAVAAFRESLTVFTRDGFPFQHALVKHNLGLAWAGMGGTANLRRALASFEDAVALFDPRLHAEPWQQSFASLERVEKELASSSPEGQTRATSFVALLLVAGADERLALLKERLIAIMARPEENRRRSLVELALASAQLGFDDARKVMDAELSVLIELPTEQLGYGLQARFDANRRLQEGDVRDDADRALDQAVSDALQGPQRIAVRDFLYSIGWERP